MFFLYKYYNLKRLDIENRNFFYRQEIKSFKKKKNVSLDKYKKFLEITRNVEQLDSQLFSEGLLQKKNDTDVILYRAENVYYNRWLFFFCDYSKLSNLLNNMIFFSNSIQEKFRYINSFHSGRYSIFVKIKNKTSNSFGSLVHHKKLLCSFSSGSIKRQYKEEKYGNYLLSKKLQRYLLLYKWKKQHLVKNIIFECSGLKRFSRTSFGHITQLVIRVLKRLRRMLKRYENWLLKFARIASRLRRIPVLTHRQRSHSKWLYSLLRGKSGHIFIMSQLRLTKSYKHGINFTKKRTGKFSYGY